MAQENRVGIAKRRRGDLETVTHPKLNLTVVRRRRRVVRPVEVDGVRWVVARVMSGFEFAVADDLVEAGFRTFAPFEVRVALRARVRGSEARVKVARDWPVFHGYVFVGCPDGLLVTKLSHDRVLDVLGGGVGLSVDPEAIRTLSDLQLGGVFNRKTNDRKFAPGDVVNVRKGPFRGMFGKVEAMLPREMRVTVALGMFGGAVPVTLEAGQLELARV